MLGLLKWQARQLAELHAVERVTLYDAAAFAPPGSDSKDGSASLLAVCFDVAVPAETSSPEAGSEIRAAPGWQALTAALAEKARKMHQIAARNVRRVGDADKTRPGLFLFNYFTGDDPTAAVEVWDTWLAGTRRRPAWTTPPCSSRWRASTPTTC